MLNETSTDLVDTTFHPTTADEVRDSLRRRQAARQFVKNPAPTKRKRIVREVQWMDQNGITQNKKFLDEAERTAQHRINEARSKLAAEIRRHEAIARRQVQADKKQTDFAAFISAPIKSRQCANGGFRTRNVREVIALVARYSRLLPADIIGHRKSRHIVKARHCAMSLASRYCGLSIANVGRMMTRDHTTVLHGNKKHAQRQQAKREARRILSR